MDLFEHARQEQIEKEAPLAARMRPRTLDEFAGQEHIVGPGRLLRRAIQADQMSSLIFYGPPGTGKTTLAAVIANTTRSHFETLNAVLAGVADIRRVTKEAQERRAQYGQRTIVFVDEVHRWNKAQQDALLPWVENGTIIMIGATTENPYFTVNRPLVSRSRIFQLKLLAEQDLAAIARRALSDPERGYGHLKIDMHDDALAHLVDVANGDARGVLNALELAIETTPPNAEGDIVIDMAVAEESIQRRAVLYDKDGDYHYDIISAFIKSVRGSDPDATLYWLAKMVYAGEDPRFLFRRMLILAGEDIGLADPNAIRVVTACAEAFDRVGLPEGRFHLAEAALYLATAPKSNSALGFFDALATVEQERESDVPVHLKDASRDKEGFGHGEGYLYPHAYRDHWVAQQYLPQTLQGKVFYQPGDQGYERGIHDQVARRREAQLAAMVEDVGEVLTFRPGERAHDRWLQRAVGNAGERLGHLRDRVLDAARIQRHHLVLDLNAGTGLLTWEILRRAPEGETLALARDRQAGEGLRQQAERLPEMERPAVLVGEIDELSALLALRGEGDLLFDAVVGRNALGRLPDKAGALRSLAGRLRPGGRLSLAETIARYTQRLYSLVGDDPSRLGEDLYRRVCDAEEAIYADSGDPFVNWEAADLERLLAEAGFEGVTAEVEAQTNDLLVTQAVLDRWFALDAERGLASPALQGSASGDGGRPSYAQHLLRRITPQELALVRAEFQRRLAGQPIPWRAETVFLAAARP